MNLILKRIPRNPHQFALFTEDGQQLPQQYSTTLVSKPDDVTRLIVEFIVDAGGNIIVDDSYGA